MYNPNTNDDSPPPNPTLKNTRGELTRLEQERTLTEESRIPFYTQEDADKIFNDLMRQRLPPTKLEKAIIRNYSRYELGRLYRAIRDAGEGTKSKKIKKKLKKKTRRVKRKRTNKKKKQGKKLRSVSNRTKTPFLKRVTKTIPKEVPTPTVNRRGFFPGMARGNNKYNITTSAPRKSPYVPKMMATKGY